MRRLGVGTVLVLSVLLAASRAAGLEIWEIQGPGLRSPYEDQAVSTAGNTVTAVGSGLFFIQSPDSRTDGDPWTSDGVLVNPVGDVSVAVGDRVSVAGTVVEHYGQTEIRGDVSVTVTSTGHPVPDPVGFGRRLPVGHQPWPPTELERFEGMRIRVEDGMISGPTDEYGDAWATSTGRRLFREPGIRYPGLPDLPVWDGNPEGFEVDPDALGGAHLDLTAGSRFAAEGVLAYAFGSYQLWPTELHLLAEPAFPSTAPPVASDRVVIASQNLERLARAGGDVPYQQRLGKISALIREAIGRPDILAVQEADDLRTLQDLADRVADDDPGTLYVPYLVEGNDPSGIDVGFLILASMPVERVVQVGADVVFSWDGTLLFDRPPLLVEVEAAGLELTVVAVHLKSLGGIEDPGSAGERVRRKRFEQSLWLADWVQQRRLDTGGAPLMVIGDFNAFEFSDGYVDVIGQITGAPDPAGALLSATEVVDPPLENLVWRISPSQRYSYIYRGSAEVLDHALVSPELRPLVLNLRFARGNADAPDSAASRPGTALRSSDHDGIVVTLGAPVRASGRRHRP